MKKQKTISLLVSVALVLPLQFSSCDTPSQIGNEETSAVTQGKTVPDIDFSLPLSTISPDLSGFSDSDDAGDSFSSDAMYTFRALESPPDGSVLGNDVYRDEAGNVCIAASAAEAKLPDRVHRYRQDGTYIETVTVQTPVCDVGEATKMPMLLSDNTVLYTTQVYPAFGAPEGATADILLVSVDGEILACAELPDMGVSDICLLPDGRIAAAVSTGSVFLYDRALQLQCEIPVSANEILYTSEGALYLQTGWTGQYDAVDLERLTSAPMRDYDPKNLADTAELHFSTTPGTYAAYFADDRGLWGLREGEDEAVLLCDWLQSGQTFTTLDIALVFDETRMLLSLKDPFSSDTVWGMLYRETDAAEENREKRLVTVGLLGVDSATETHIVNAVSRFNAENAAYYVTVSTYAHTGRTPQEVKSEEFETALLEAYGQNAARGQIRGI